MLQSLGSSSRGSSSHGSVQADCSPVLLQAIKIAATTVQQLPATRPPPLIDANFRQLHAGGLCLLGTLCSFLPTSPPTSALQQAAAAQAVPSCAHQAAVLVAAAVPGLAASLRQVAAFGVGDGILFFAQPAVAARPLSLLCMALGCALRSLSGLSASQLSTEDVRRLLVAGATGEASEVLLCAALLAQQRWRVSSFAAAGPASASPPPSFACPAALRLLPLLLTELQVERASAADLPGAAAAAAKQLARRCLKAALLCEAVVEQQCLQAPRRPGQQQASCISQLEPDLHSLHTAACQLAHWLAARSSSGSDDLSWRVATGGACTACWIRSQKPAAPQRSRTRLH